ncbi:MAG: universal stress protein [Chloroflexi bacterium]|nr:universal stress protein [Chloroflexota bacterium]
MYRRILVTLDGTKLAERVLAYVRLLAKPMGARITLLKVVEHLPPHVGTELNPVRNVHRTLPYRIEKARRYLSALAIGLEADGLDVECLVLDGNPGPEIIKQAKLVPGTMVAMSTHGRYGLPRAWFGSVTDQVLRKTEIPMLIIGPDVDWDATTGPKLERVIVALDGSGFAEKVLPHAVTVAKALGLTIVLARVTPAEGLYYYQDGERDSVEEVIPRDLDASAEQYLSEIERGLRRQQVHSVEKRVLHDQEPAAALAGYAADGGSSLIALTTHARSGLARGLIGSVADSLVQEYPHPLLVLHVAHHSAVDNPKEGLEEGLNAESESVG